MSRLILGTTYAHLEFLFRRDCPLPAHWRWGATLDAMILILRLRSALPLLWDPNKFCNKPEINKLVKDNADRLHVHGALTTTIRSKLWQPHQQNKELETSNKCMIHTHKIQRWGYLAMLVKLHRLVASVLTWAESCRCHGWLRR